MFIWYKEELGLGMVLVWVWVEECCHGALGGQVLVLLSCGGEQTQISKDENKPKKICCLIQDRNKFTLPVFSKHYLCLACQRNEKKSPLFRWCVLKHSILLNCPL